jgi:hypothetical protein
MFTQHAGGQPILPTGRGASLQYAKGVAMSDASEAPDEGRLDQRPPEPDAAEPVRDDPGFVTEPSPDVYLNVPAVKVDEMAFEVEDLRGRVSLQAEVLDLLKLNIGVDTTMGRVAFEMRGVEVEALLKVQLDNVAAIVDRVLKTIDRNPQILEQLTRDLEPAAGNADEEAREAVKQVGRGPGETAEAVAESAGEAVERAGRGTRETAEDVREVESGPDGARSTSERSQAAEGKARTGNRTGRSSGHRTLRTRRRDPVNRPQPRRRDGGR